MVFTLMGKTGIPEVQKMMSQVSRLIVAGNKYNLTKLPEMRHNHLKCLHRQLIEFSHSRS